MSMPIHSILASFMKTQAHLRRIVEGAASLPPDISPDECHHLYFCDNTSCRCRVMAVPAALFHQAAQHPWVIEGAYRDAALQGLASLMQGLPGLCGAEDEAAALLAAATIYLGGTKAYAKLTESGVTPAHLFVVGYSGKSQYHLRPFIAVQPLGRPYQREEVEQILEAVRAKDRAAHPEWFQRT